jgi:hypothetical protein
MLNMPNTTGLLHSESVREVQWLVNRQGAAKLEDEFQVFLKKSAPPEEKGG